MKERVNILQRAAITAGGIIFSCRPRLVFGMYGRPGSVWRDCRNEECDKSLWGPLETSKVQANRRVDSNNLLKRHKAVVAQRRTELGLGSDLNARITRS